MKAAFFEYHTPTKAEFDELWRKAVFSFDASVLLDLYRFSSESREELIRLLKTRRDRIWLTHQSAYEFHKNRLQVIGEASKRAAELRATLTSLQRSVSTEFKQHPYVSANLCDGLSTACTNALNDLQSAEANYPNLLSEDPIAKEVLEIFDGLVGQPFENEKLSTLYSQVASRYDRQIPPGYRDRKNKEEEKSYGDCILWFQLIAFAKEKGCPIILVTRDLKEDWWLRESGKTLMPRPELRREFRESTGGYDFYLYQTPNFIELAKEYPRNAISDRLIQESRVIAESLESRRQDQSMTSDDDRPTLLTGFRAIGGKSDSGSAKLDASSRNFQIAMRELEELLRARRPITSKMDRGATIDEDGKEPPASTESNVHPNAESEASQQDPL